MKYLIIMVSLLTLACSQPPDNGDADTQPSQLWVFADTSFLVAGQSNAASGPWDTSTEYSHTGKTSVAEGYGTGAPRIPTVDYPMVNSRSWLILGDLLNIDITFVNIAKGGSGADEWRDTYFDQRMAPALQTHKYTAILWVQGETECSLHTTSGHLYTTLKGLIQRSQEIQPGVIWFVALDSCIDPNDSAQVRAAESQIVTDGYAKQGPDLDVIRQIPEEMTPNFVEFLGDGLIHHAQLWYPVISSFLN